MPSLVRVRFARVAQFELVADAFRSGSAQLIDLAVPNSLGQLAVAFLLGLSTGTGGELERMEDGTYLLTPPGWEPSEDERTALSLAA